jgi:hypothetical protein
MIGLIKIKEGEYKEYYENGNLKIHCFYKDDKLEGEYREYFENKNLHLHCFYKDNKLEGEYKEYFENKNLHLHLFYKNNLLNGKHKQYFDYDSQLCKYYINGQIIIKYFKFKTEFALLKFKNVLNSKIRKPRYKLLDRHFIPDISDIIGTYLFTLSKYNFTGKRIYINDK